MYSTLGIKTDYSLLKSLIKINDLVNFSVQNNIPYLGILDDNLFGSIEFYDTLIKNNIKPIIGLDCQINKLNIYLYAQDYEGYKTLLKINTICQTRELTVADLKLLNYQVILVIPYQSLELYDSLKNVFKLVYLSYQNNLEKRNALVLTKNIIFLNIVNCFEETDLKFFPILDKIRDDGFNTTISESYFKKIEQDDIDNLNHFVTLIALKIDKSQRYIPHFALDIKDSFNYLYNLCKKGLTKRLDGQISSSYLNRLHYELKVINDMGFVDYFLIVYDYVKYAKTHDIMVGAGRGSAAGSLVSYAIGIKNIDPLKYNLLFERFLNPQRITMPDIDVDFEDTKRDLVVSYVKEKYGVNNVARIMTFGTLASRQVIKDVARAMDFNEHIEELAKLIDSKASLRDNLISNKHIKSLLDANLKLQEVFNIALKLEGLKRHISTHAAGVVICSEPLDNLIPVCYNDANMLTGLTMNYLEELGLLKMDVLALSNLSIMHNILNLIPDDIDLNKISLDDERIFTMLSAGEGTGIFQFESSGMRNFLKKLKPKTFSDLYAALALFRPGPMDNIDTFIARKNGQAKIEYLDASLEPILKETYGIIVYQEQIMQILVKMANYTFAEADNIRRAMSKKKEAIIIAEEKHFISSAMKNGYSEATSQKVYAQILKFANYGFNKAHSVSYAMIGYQMAYLKVNYPIYFIANLLNMMVGNDLKTKEYIGLAKQNNISIIKPCINLSIKDYKIGENKLRLPLNVIKGVGNIAVNDLLEERKKGDFKDYFDFVARTYNKNVNKKVLENLILGGALDIFKINRHTLIANMDNALRYAELRSNLDETLVEKLVLGTYEEYNANELMQQELDVYGFYLSNHPASKYNGQDIVKLSQISKYFNKFIKSVVIINNVREIKTKTGTKRAFLSCSDETGSLEFILFPKNMDMLMNINKNDLVLINGVVAKRFDEYQININKIAKM